MLKLIEFTNHNGVISAVLVVLFLIFIPRNCLHPEF